MPIQIINVADLPRSTRNKTRSLENTDEWIQLRAKLAEGLKKDEAVCVTFTPEFIKRAAVKAPSRVFREMVLAYIKKLDLDYRVWRYRSEGNEVLAIARKNSSSR